MSREPDSAGKNGRNSKECRKNSLKRQKILSARFDNPGEIGYNDAIITDKVRMKCAMDQLDLEILNCLRENARLSASKISRKVNLSVSSVLERIHRMEEQGVILRYTAVVDQSKLGRPLMMLMGVSMESPQYYESFERSIKEEPDVTSCEYLTGSMDYLLRVTAQSHEHLQNLHHRIAMMEGVASITSYYVLKNVKDE